MAVVLLKPEAAELVALVGVEMVPLEKVGPVKVAQLIQAGVVALVLLVLALAAPES